MSSYAPGSPQQYQQDPTELLNSELASSGKLNSLPRQDNFFTPDNHTFYARSPYSSLDYTKQEIRLLRILSAEDVEPLEIELVGGCITSNRAQPNYCAVSYYAGNHTDTTLIKINGFNFNAFSNLAQALKQTVRAPRGKLQTYPQLIWADQICINQSNPSERSHQISFMRNIYQNATTVLACLGENEKHRLWTDVFTPWHTFMDSERISSESLSTTSSVEVEVTKFIFGDILSSPWWGRGWIYQEVIVSRKIFLIFGSGIDDLDRFSSMIYLAKDILRASIHMLVINKNFARNEESALKILYRSDTAHAEFILDARKKWSQGARSNLELLLMQSRECKVTDPRDKIYAFIGIVNGNYNIVPDYTKDVSFAYRQACKKIILDERSLNVLKNDIQKNKRSNLPSWTPDWSSELDTGLWFRTPAEDRFSASGDYHSAATFHADLHGIPDSILRVQGLILDRVAYENTIGQPDGFEGVHTNAILRNWARAAATNRMAGNEESVTEQKYFNGHSVKEAYYSNLLQEYSHNDLENVEQSSSEYNIWHIRAQAYNNSLEALFFRSPKGYMGLVEEGVQSTDFLCILLGLSVPAVLRQEDSYYRFVGLAYIEGLMDGEAIEMMQRGELTVETIDIH